MSWSNYDENGHIIPNIIKGDKMFKDLMKETTAKLLEAIKENNYEAILVLTKLLKILVDEDYGKTD